MIHLHDNNQSFEGPVLYLPEPLNNEKKSRGRQGRGPEKIMLSFGKKELNPLNDFSETSNSLPNKRVSGTLPNQTSFQNEI